LAEELLKDLFNLTNQLYKSKIYELSNRLWAIRNSSFLDSRIQSSVNRALTRLDKYIEEIEGVKNDNSKTFKDKFSSIREVERNIRREEEILVLLEDVTDTFVSNRSLSTALSNLFEYLYSKITRETMPFLITSGKGVLETIPYLKDEKNKIAVGTIGMPLYSASHLDEWILAGHELGHIIANKKFGMQLKYEEKTKENSKMELLSDKIALQIFGPVFLEALAMKLTGGEYMFIFPEYFTYTHPSESWRIWICYYQARAFKFDAAKIFIESIESIINDIYERPKDKLFDEIKDDLSTDKYDLNEVNSIEDLKECYDKADELSSKWIENGYDTTDIESYDPDQIVIAGYLTSRKNPEKLGLCTQQVINSLIRKQNYY